MFYLVVRSCQYQMRYHDKIHTGVLTKMWVSDQERSSGKDDYLNGNPVSSASFTLTGIQGDRHNGISHKSGARQKAVYERGSIIRNNRLWTAISPGEVDVIANNLHIEGLTGGHLGCNLEIEGLGPITKLPPLTLLQLSPFNHFAAGRPEDVTLIVYAEVLPCVIAGRSIASTFGDATLAGQFPAAALGCRGCTGWIEKAGTVHTGWYVHQLTPLYQA